MRTSSAPRVKLDELCHINQSSCLVETPCGYAVVQQDMRVFDGAKVLLAGFGRMQFAIVHGGSLITEDGEAIEGDAVDDVEVIGVVTYVLNGAPTEPDSLPVM
jgi:hypothetical protein